MGDITAAIASITKENKDFKRALNILIKYEIHCLLQRLADTGEEAILITSEVWDCADLATQKGQTFVRDTAEVLNLKTIFQKYCRGEVLTEDDMVSVETCSNQEEVDAVEPETLAPNSPNCLEKSSDHEPASDPAPETDDQVSHSPTWSITAGSKSKCETTDSSKIQLKSHEQKNTISCQGSLECNCKTCEDHNGTDDVPVDFSWKCDTSTLSLTEHDDNSSPTASERNWGRRRVSETSMDDYTAEMKRLDCMRGRKFSLHQDESCSNGVHKSTRDSTMYQHLPHSASIHGSRQSIHGSRSGKILSYLPLKNHLELGISLPPACFTSLFSERQSQIACDLMAGETDILGCHIARRFKELDAQLVHGGCSGMLTGSDGDLCQREVRMFQNNRGSLAVDIPVCKQDCDNNQIHEEKNKPSVSPVALKNRILKRLRSTECSTSTESPFTRSSSISESTVLDHPNGSKTGDVSLVANTSGLPDSEPINLVQDLSPESSKHDSGSSSQLDRQGRESDSYSDIQEQLQIDIKLEPDASDEMSGSEETGDGSLAKYPGPRVRSHSGSLIHLNFTCKICGQNFKNRQYRDFHVKMHKSPHKFLCSLCNTGFDREDDCIKHQSSHTDPIYQCENCGYKCSREFRMRAHKEICGEPKKIHKCPYCDKQFAAQRYMRIHMKSHDMGNIHTCPYCQNTYPLKNSLLKHIKKKHLP